MNIFLVGDSNVIAPLATCIASLQSTQTLSELRLHIAIPEGEAESFAEFIGWVESQPIQARVLPIDAAQLDQLRAKMRDGHVSAAGLYRVLIADILQDVSGRVLYLDADTVVLQPLDALMSMEMLGYPVVAASEPMYHLYDLGVTDADYVNTGVLLIDLDVWRTKSCDAQILQVMQTLPERLVWWDQCALNIALQGQIGRLERKYNHMHRAGEPVGKARDASIIHYAGSVKPWDRPRHHPLGRLYCRASRGTPWPTRYSKPFRARVVRRLQKWKLIA